MNLSRRSFLKAALFATAVAAVQPTALLAGERRKKELPQFQSPHKGPEGLLLCDGRTVKAYQYPDLFKALSDSRQINPGQTLWRLPDLRVAPHVGQRIGIVHSDTVERPSSLRRFLAMKVEERGEC